MSLQFLDFDYSEDADGGGSFDAMASVRQAQLAAVRADIAEVLDWAETVFAGQRAPLDEGGEWDVDLQERTDAASPPWHVLTPCPSAAARPFARRLCSASAWTDRRQSGGKRSASNTRIAAQASLAA